MYAHLKHHARFYGAALIGALVWAVLAWAGSPLQTVVAGDAFFASYLVSTALLALRVTPDDMRKRASYEDEGILLIALLTLGAVSLSLTGIFVLLDETESFDTKRFVLVIAGVPLGWFTLHTIAAFRYAHLYYTRAHRGHDARGLEFPGTEEPTSWDFLYYSFVVGMTAQVSDIRVMTPSMRRLTLTHAIVSFFFNTVLLALAVNIAAKGWR